MANQRDINRWKKGKDHWNKWAEGRLKAKEKLERQGKWAVDEDGSGTNAATRRWMDSVKVDFSENVFKGNAGFEGYIFPCTVNFSGAEFGGSALLDAAEFKGNAQFDWAKFGGHAFFGAAKFGVDAGFDRAEFSEDAWFDAAEFSGEAWFGRAKFGGDAWFDAAEFGGHAWFDQCTFAGSCDYYNANFIVYASFNSSISDGPFSLADATFEQVPDFIQMSFRAPAPSRT